MGVSNTLGLSRVKQVSFQGVSARLSRIGAWFTARRRVAQITRELAPYSDRDLADMGFTRGDIPAIANGQLRRS